MFKRRWKAQGFLTAWFTGTKRYPYEPTYHFTRKGAEREVAILRRDHGPGMLQTEITRRGND